LSQKGQDKIKSELDELVNVKSPAISEDIARYREDGELKESTPYLTALEELTMVETKIKELESILDSGFIVDIARLPKDRVVFGTRVEVTNQKTGKKEVYHLIGEGEANPDKGWILTTAPLGQVFMRKKVGEEVVAELSSGTVTYIIDGISFIDN